MAARAALLIRPTLAQLFRGDRMRSGATKIMCLTVALLLQHLASAQTSSSNAQATTPSSTDDFTLPGSGNLSIPGGVGIAEGYLESIRWKTLFNLETDHRLQNNRYISMDVLDCPFQLWIDPMGTATRVEVTGAHCDPQINAALQRDIVGTGSEAPPPLSMPLSIVFVDDQATYESYVFQFVINEVHTKADSQNHFSDLNDFSFKVWVAPTGTITLAEISTPGSGWQTDGPLQKDLIGEKLRPPPVGIKMPIWEGQRVEPRPG